MSDGEGPVEDDRKRATYRMIKVVLLFEEDVLTLICGYAPQSENF